MGMALGTVRTWVSTVRDLHRCVAGTGSRNKPVTTLWGDIKREFQRAMSWWHLIGLVIVIPLVLPGAAGSMGITERGLLIIGRAALPFLVILLAPGLILQDVLFAVVSAMAAHRRCSQTTGVLVGVERSPASLTMGAAGHNCRIRHAWVARDKGGPKPATQSDQKASSLCGLQQPAAEQEVRPGKWVYLFRV